MCQHLIGRNIKYYGADHVIWGTDCLWWGSPQWVIDAFKRFQITDELCDKFGYKKLTKEDKAKIFGLNAAKIYGVDVERQAQGLPKDALHEAQGGLPRQRRPARQRRLRLGARRGLERSSHEWHTGQRNDPPGPPSKGEQARARRAVRPLAKLEGVGSARSCSALLVCCSTTAGSWPSPPVTLDPAAWGSDHVGQPVPEYVDGNECLFCHRNDVGVTWSDNHHNRSVREIAPDSPALAALQAAPGLKQAAGEVSLVMGGDQRQRFLKPAAAFGQLDLFSVAWVPPRRGRGEAGRDRSASLGREDVRRFVRRLSFHRRRFAPADLRDAFARLRCLSRRRAERPHQGRGPRSPLAPAKGSRPGDHVHLRPVSCPYRHGKEHRAAVLQ